MSEQRLRELCMTLPEATEKISHGGPSWFVRKRMFCSYVGPHHSGRPQFWCAAPPGAQEELIDDNRYFRPPYVGHRGWLGVHLDVPLDWVEVAEIIQDAYRCVAPKTLVAQLPQR